MSAWLDTETKAILQPSPPEKLAPTAIAGYTLVMLSRGEDECRVAQAVNRARQLSQSDAALLMSKPCPLPIQSGLSLEDAYLGQFEMVCCDTVAIFLSDEVAEAAEKSYLDDLYKSVGGSTEFKETSVKISDVPNTDEGHRFLDQFIGWPNVENVPLMPMIMRCMHKKARLMEHWAKKVGATVVDLKTGSNIASAQ